MALGGGAARATVPQSIERPLRAGWMVCFGDREPRRQLLTERGLTLSLRGKPGNLAVENYW